MNFSAAIPTFVVTLREGVEAALVVGIVLAALRKAQRTHLNAWVYGGIGVGLGGSVLVGVLLSGLLAGLDGSTWAYAPVVKPALAALFCGVAIAMLSWMLIWMTQQAKSLKAEIETALSAALEGSQQAGWGVFGLVAIAVLREGFETVLFLAAQFQQGPVPLLGAIAGLTGAVVIGMLLFWLGIKINLRQFFKFMGILLLLIVAGLVVSALKNVDGAIAALSALQPDTFGGLCWSRPASCLLGPQVWDARGVLPDTTFPGILLKTLFGYRQQLYALQAVGYLVFLGTVGRRYLRSLDAPAAPPSPAPAQPTLVSKS